MRRDDPFDELYEAPLREFVPRRNAIVARLKKADRGDDAKALAGVPKPKATVWAINRVARTSPKVVKRVVSAFDALKTAQLRAPAKMSAASGDLREAMEAAVHEVLGALKESGVGTSLDTHRRITNTLRGAAASERDALFEGRLADEVAPGGFDLFGGAMPSGTRPRTHAVASPPAPARDDLARRRAAQLEAEAREREEAARSASAAVLEARERLRELQAKARATSRTAKKSRGLAERATRRAGKPDRAR